MSLPNPNQELAIPLEALAIKMLNGYSPMLCIVGDETGIGKSRIALRTAELVYNRVYGQTWKPLDNVFFSMTKFKDSLFDSHGRIFILEEAEIELGSDDWTSISNRWFSRIKDTQRIKGNLYIVVLPLLMALARKHRRRINFIFDVKSRGYCNCYKLKKHSANLLGDEMGKFFIGSVRFTMPDCDTEFDMLDKENKNRIEKEQSDVFDKEIRYHKLIKERRLQKLERAVKMPKSKTDFEYEYKCHNCKAIIKSHTPIDKVILCKNCNCKVYINKQNLFKDNTNDDIEIDEPQDEDIDEDNDDDGE